MYVSSFCEEKNYSYASKQYGEDCIGFKLEFIKQFGDNNSAILGRVKYNLKEQIKIISDMFDLYEDASEELVEKRVSLFCWLSVIFPLLKEEIDHIDNECRIITAEIREPNNPTRIIGKPSAKEVKFCTDNIIIDKMRG